MKGFCSFDSLYYKYMFENGEHNVNSLLSNSIKNTSIKNTKLNRTCLVILVGL